MEGDDEEVMEGVVYKRVIATIMRIGDKPFTASQLRLEIKILYGKDTNITQLFEILDQLEMKGVLKKTPKWYQYELEEVINDAS